MEGTKDVEIQSVDSDEINRDDFDEWNCTMSTIENENNINNWKYNQSISDHRLKAALSTFRKKDLKVLARKTFCHICNWITTVGEMANHFKIHNFQNNP